MKLVQSYGLMCFVVLKNDFSGFFMDFKKKSSLDGWLFSCWLVVGWCFQSWLSF